MKEPLKNRRIVITRSLDQVEPLRSQLEDLGAEVIALPLIQISAHHDPATLDDIWAEIASYGWIAFTSRNGVRYFFEAFFRRFSDIRCLGPMRIACIGEGTAEALKAYYLEVDIMPEEALADKLAEAMIKTESLDNEKVLVVTGNLNRPDLVVELEGEGRAIVDTLQVYKTEKTDLSTNPVAGQFREAGADAILFTSASGVSSFRDQAASLQLKPNATQPVAVSIGPITTEAMTQAGLPAGIEAKTHSLDGICEALTEHFAKKTTT
tara:strand:- start:25253 stop:26050 length:798 start_codon:yes stop_codon:yes gene_type:complete